YSPINDQPRNQRAAADIRGERRGGDGSPTRRKSAAAAAGADDSATVSSVADRGSHALANGGGGFNSSFIDTCGESVQDGGSRSEPYACQIADRWNLLRCAFSGRGPFRQDRR